MPNPLADATSKLVDILVALDSADRRRVVDAALTLLGDGPTKTNISSEPEESMSSALSQFPPQARVWARKYHVLSEHLEQVFHIDQAGVQPIALPGSTNKKIEQTANTYLVQGIAALLSTGESSFADEDARKLCEHFGCYDSTNHSRYVKAIGSRITGSKSAGWKLTAPGLEAAADLIKSGST